jgi:NTE family protein
MEIQNLVFQGGGVKGIAYAGALRELERQGVLGGVVNVAGTSAGAITAALLAVGVTAGELEATLRGTDFTSFMDGAGWVVRESARLFKKYGAHPGQVFEAWLRAQLGAITERTTGRARPDITFAELRDLAAQHPDRLRNLYVVTTNLTRQVAEVFSAETRPDVPVFQAVRMSMSIPLFFEAVRFEEDLYIDGGVSWNYPIDLFDGARRQAVIGGPVALEPVPPSTLGFSLGTQAQIASAQRAWQPLPIAVDSMESYAHALCSFVLTTSTLLHLDAAAIPRTVFIDDASVPTTEFEITPAQMDVLIENGAAATRDWLARSRA